MTVTGPRTTDAAGLRRFAGFALGPDEQGTIDEADHQLVAAWLAEGDEVVPGPATLEAMARAFASTLPYLEVIAEASRIANPFDERVLEAHWLGNDLLEAVKPRLAARRLLQVLDATHPPAAARVREVLTEVSPTHAQRVLLASPWADALHEPRDDAELLARLDGCMVRLGTVESVDGDRATVRSRHLVLRGGRLADGLPVVESYRLQGRAGTAWLSPGDSVALHWDEVVERLIPVQVKALQQSIARAVQLVNGQLTRQG